MLSPNQIAEWIRRAISPEEISDEHVGLPPNDDEPARLAAGARAESAHEHAEGSETPRAPESRGIEERPEETPREAEARRGADPFPSKGAGSEDEVEGIGGGEKI